MAKGGGGSSTTSANIPKELKPLYTQTGQGVMGIQNEAPMSQYLGKNPTQIAPLSGTQVASLGLLNQNLSDAMTPLEDAPIMQAGHRYVENTILPGVTNEATLSGLGRSTANTNARAAAEAQTMMPLLQGEQARRDAMINQGFYGGDIERSIGQMTNNAEQEDFLRRQGISEKALFGPLMQLPNTFGSTTKTSTSGGGMLGK